MATVRLHVVYGYKSYCTVRFPIAVATVRLHVVYGYKSYCTVRFPIAVATVRFELLQKLLYG